MKKLVMFSIIVIFLISSVTALNQEFTNNKINNNILVNYNRDHRNLMLIELLEQYLTLDVNFLEEFIAGRDQEVQITVRFNPPGNRVWVLRNLQVIIIPDNPINNEPIILQVPTIKAGGRFNGRRTVTTELNYPEADIYHPRIYLNYQGIRYLDRIYDLEIVPNGNEIIRDGIKYYMQTNKYSYRIGEGVEMLYRITNLRDEEVVFNFGNPLQNDFVVTNISDDVVWRLSYVDGRAWLRVETGFDLQPGESQEFSRIWDQTTDVGTTDLEDDEPIDIGNYEASGMLWYGMSQDERIEGPYYTPVSVHLEIIEE